MDQSAQRCIQVGCRMIGRHSTSPHFSQASTKQYKLPWRGSTSLDDTPVIRNVRSTGFRLTMVNPTPEVRSWIVLCAVRLYLGVGEHDVIP
jgi:hypothetical protein